ncbi:MAG: HAMP domain-containing sensor histidine kinase [Clostridia bacterium]|nr:HAMP domain-containing sensor histidine kinase [Clostridia bacterium]
MKKSDSGSLFSRYFFISFLTVFVSCVILIVLFVSFFANYWANQTITILERNLGTLSVKSEQMNLRSDSSHNTEKQKADFKDYMNVISDATSAEFFFCDNDGNIILQSDRHKFSRSHIDIDKRTYQKISEDTYYAVSMPGKSKLGEDKNLIRSIVVIKQRSENDGYIVGVRSIYRGLSDTIVSFLKILLLAETITFLLSIIIVYSMTYNLTMPILQMTKLTQQYARGDFSQRLEVKGSNEISILSENFNEMASSLSNMESSMSSFVANISHELKTPMTSISGYIDGILDGTIPEKDRNKYLNKVSREVKRLAKLSVAMLQLSKIQSGEGEPIFTRMDLSKTTVQILFSFEDLINQKNIDVIGLDKLNPEFVEADERFIYQVIYNLVDNAVKFTNVGGYIETKIYSQNDNVYFILKNSGDGIDGYELTRIFERFYKVDKSRSKDIRSSGLGLNLVKTIIEMHNGKIHAASKLGEYTQFKFFLPKKQDGGKK